MTERPCSRERRLWTGTKGPLSVAVVITMLLSMLGIVAVAAAVPASAADAPHLTFTVAPAGATGGLAFTTQPVVTIEDDNGDPLTTSTALVSLTASGGSTGATLTCAPVNAVAGVATFAGCAVDKAGTGYVLTAASPGSTGTDSPAFAVAVGGPAQVVFTTQPGNIVAGTPFSPDPAVALADAGGNIVAADPAKPYTFGLIALDSASLPGRLVCTGGETPVNDASASGYKLQPSGGATGATFAACTVSSAGASQTLFALATDAAQNQYVGVSTSFSVGGGAATKVAFSSQPVGAHAGSPLSASPVVAIQDAAGNVVTGDNSTVVTLALAAGATGLTCTDTTVTAAAGLAHFDGCSVAATGTYAFTASAAGLTPAESAPFVMSAGTPATAAFAPSPGNGNGGAALATQPAVTVTDASGAPVAATVSLAIASGTAGATLSCANNPIAAGAGTASFSGCQVDKTGTYTVTATVVGTNVTATSQSFVVGAGGATHAVITTTPLNAIAGGTLAPSPVVQLRDAGENVVAAATGSVRLAIAPGTGAAGATLACTTNPVGATGGLASFAGCKVTPASTVSYRLAATTPVGVALGAAFNVSVGTPAKIAFSAKPTTYLTGGLLSTQPQVIVQDSAGNTLTDASVDATLAATGGTLACASSPHVTGPGVAAFSGCAVTGAGNVTLTASAPGLGTATAALTKGTGAGVGTTAPPAVPKEQTFGGSAYGTNPSAVTNDVNGATGALQVSSPDLTVAGIGAPLEVVRNYNSADVTGGVFGAGWSSVFDAGVTFLDQNLAKARVRGEDGQQLVYTRGSKCLALLPCAYLPPPGAHADVVCTLTACVVKRFDGTTLLSNAGKIATYTAPTGWGLGFVYQNGKLANVLVTQAGAPLAVAVATDANGRITSLTTPTRSVRYSYSAAGLLVSFRDANAKTTTYTYDGAGRLTQITDALGQARLTADYDASGRVAHAAELGSPRHFVDAYAWAAAAQTSTRTTLLKPGTPPNAAPVTGTYLERYAGNALLWAQQPSGATTAFTYDNALNVTAFQEPSGGVQRMTYSASGDQLTQVAPDGATTKLTYTPQHDVLTSTDPNGNTTGYSYVAQGVLGWVIPPDPADPKNQPGAPGRVGTHYVYNLLGQVVEVQSPTGLQSFTYDVAGNVAGTQRFAANDGLHLKPLNGKGPLNAYDEAGNLLSSVDARGRTAANGTIDPAYRTTSTYDATGRLLTTTLPGRAASTTTYTDAGDVASVTPAGQATTAYSWDEGRLTMTATTGSVPSISVYDVAGSLLTTIDASHHQSNYTYDSSGRVLTETDPSGVTSTYGYDTAGTVATWADSVGHAGTFAYDLAHRMTASTVNGVATTKSFDKVGNILTATDSTGVANTYKFNNHGLLASVTNGAGATSYGYDLGDRVTTVTDGNAHATTYTYDGADRVTAMVVSGKAWTYSYDLAGNRTVTTDPDSRKTTQSYSPANDVTDIVYTQTGQPQINVHQTFDTAGRRLTMTDGAGNHTYSYDASGNMLTATGPGAGFSYNYTTAGRLAETYPDNTAVTYSIDDAGNVMSVSAPGVSVSYLRDRARQVTGIAFSNGLVETTTHDPAGRLVSQQFNCAGDGRGAIDYGRDAFGNPLGQLSTVGGVTTSSGYGYDSTGRVVAQQSTTTANGIPATGCTSGTQATAGSPAGNDGSGLPTTSATGPTDVATPTAGPGLTGVAPSTANPIKYDKVGNQTTVGGVTFGYNALDQLSTATDGRTATYDNAGNLTKMVIGAQTTSYRYDAANRLVGVTMPNGQVIAYAYDGDGNRLTKSVNGAVTARYFWDPSGAIPLLVLEQDGSGNLVHRYFYGVGPVVMQSASATYYYLTNARGDVTAVADATGAIVATYAYDAYGKLLPGGVATAAADNPIRFQGQFLDLDTGLYNLRARNYDPSTGRFTQRDPVQPAVGTPALSTYVFANDRPTVNGDPTGRISLPVDLPPEVTGHSTESATDVNGAALKLKVSGIGFRGLLKLAGGPATQEGSKVLGKVLGVVGIGLGAYVTAEDCQHGPVAQCVGDAVGLGVSVVCLVATEGVGSLACAALGAGLQFVITAYGPLIVAVVGSAAIDGYNTTAEGVVSGYTTVAVGVVGGYTTAVQGTIDLGNQINAGLGVAGGVIASQVNQAASAISSGYNSAVATLVQAGYHAEQLGKVLATTFSEGAQAVLDQLVALQYDADAVVDAMRSALAWTSDQAAAFMKGAGYTVGQIASGLKTAYQFADAATAAALAGLGYAANEVASALVSAYQDGAQAVATVLRGLDYAADQVAGALKTTFNSVINDVSSLLHQAGYTAAEVANALRSAYTNVESAVAAALKAGNYVIGEITGALGTVFHDSAAGIATVLRGLTYGANEVASALRTALGLGDAAAATALKAANYTIDQVSGALQSVFGASADAAAAALKAAGYAVDQIAATLGTVFGEATSAIKNALQSAGFTEDNIKSIGGAFASGWDTVTHYADPRNWF